MNICNQIHFREYDCEVTCWLNSSSIWIYLSMVGAAIAWNLAVTVKAVSAAYNSAKIRFIRLN